MGLSGGCSRITGNASADSAADFRDLIQSDCNFAWRPEFSCGVFQIEGRGRKSWKAIAPTGAFDLMCQAADGVQVVCRFGPPQLGQSVAQVVDEKLD